MAISLVIKTAEGTVIVMNEDGELIPGYTGRYYEVREDILRDAPIGALFLQEDRDGARKTVSREEWSKE